MKLAAFHDWVKSHTTNYLLVQHEADEETNRTHTHGMLVNLDVTIEGLRKEIKKYSPGKGQYAIMTKTKKDKILYNEDKLAIYMLKGVDPPLAHLTSYPETKITGWIALWKKREDILSKDKKDATIFDVLLSARAKMELKTTWNEKGVIVQIVICNQANFITMCGALNDSRIRTSRNELERCWVTLIRQDAATQVDLFHSINNNVFR